MKNELRIFRIVACALLLLILTSTAYPAFAKPVVKAYFNGQEATVRNVTLKVNEPFVVDVNITVDADSNVGVILMEPGVSKSYQWLEGNRTYDFENVKCKAGNTCHFHWKLAPNGDWTEGDAPVNIYYQVNDAHQYDHILSSGEFTVVDPYISSEKYEKAADNGLKALPAPTYVWVTLAALCIAYLAYQRRYN